MADRLKSWRLKPAECRIIQPPERRGSASERGYDSRWSKLRERFIAEHPLCEYCAGRDLTVPAEEVDHVKPFSGPEDPLRLDETNLQSLCHACHVAKTWKDRKESHG